MGGLNMDEINKFRLFLIKNNAFDSYIKNVNNNRINNCYSSGDPFNRIIDASFIWRNTPEGEDYWLELYRKWEKQAPNCKVDYTNIVEKLLDTEFEYNKLWED